MVRGGMRACIQSPFISGAARKRETTCNCPTGEFRGVRRDYVEANQFHLEDRGQRRGLFVNDEKVESRELQNGDIITFGLEDLLDYFPDAAARTTNPCPIY